MNDAFEKRVRAAASASWRVVLAILGLFIFSYLFYLFAAANQPGWLIWLSGPGVEWPDLLHIWFWAIVAFKLIVWMSIFAALWLTLWARQLRKLER